MKKTTRKSKLRVERDVLRVLQVHELRQVDGGSETIARDVTSDSKICCCA